MDGDKQGQKLNNLTPAFPGLNFNPSSPAPLPPHPTWHRGMGNEGCSLFITASLFCSFLLTIFPSSSVGSSWAVVLQDKPAPVQAPPWAAGRLPTPAWSLRGAAGDPCQGSWSTFSLLPLSPWGSQSCSSHCSPHPLLPGSILPFLIQTPPRRHHLGSKLV